MNVNGKLTSCASKSLECCYRCCDQDGRPQAESDINIQNYILMYPGEYEENDTRCHHLESICNFAGGVLARCRGEDFDQSSCNPEQNYKPLDCRSYPFFPCYSHKEQLGLVVDKRCPLYIDEDPQMCRHSEVVLNEWQKVVADRSEVGLWIARISLKGYVVYEKNN